MFLALRELKHARLRYLMIGAILVLLAWLLFLLSGLANGLATDNASAMQNLPADYLVFQSDSRISMGRSLLPGDITGKIKEIPGVNAVAPAGQLTITADSLSGTKIDAVILAVDPASFLVPQVVEGQDLKDLSAGKVIADISLKKNNIRVGDRLREGSTGTELVITGFTKGHTYGHLPVIFMDLNEWRAIKFANPAAANGIANPISAVAVQMNSQAAEQVKALPGVEVATRQEAVEKMPGYSEESGTLIMIQLFLVAIVTFIMAAFFYVLTLQKTNQFGVLKALGASSRFLAKDLMGQVLLLAVGAVAVGILLTYTVAAVIPAKVPFALDVKLIAIYSLVLVVVALAGALFSLFRISKIDALIAIGRVD